MFQDITWNYIQKAINFQFFLIPGSDFRLRGVRFSNGITSKSVFFQNRIKIFKNLMTSDDPALREGESYNKVLNRPDLRVTVQVVDERAATRWGWARKFTTGLWCGRKVRIRGTGEIIRRTAARISNDK